jgi:glycolate oxidase iron-sulfur subunit
MDAVQETRADILVVANPGCTIQIAAGIRQRGLRMRVMHTVDLLDRAYAVERRMTSPE